MEKIKFTDLNLEVRKDIKKVKFNDFTFEVLQYLPSGNKHELLVVTLNESREEDGSYNPFALDLFFHLNLVLSYCINLEITEEEAIDPLLIYDKLNSNGIIDLIINEIDDREYQKLFEDLQKMVLEKTKKNLSIVGSIQNLSKELPKMIEKAETMLSNFDTEKYKNVIDFENHANGDRNINTNQLIE